MKVPINPRVSYKMNDESLMPWGKWKGTKMINVPPEYLLFIYENNYCTPNVKAYIEDALDFIKGEIALKKKNNK